MWNKVLTESVLMLCLSIVLFADQKNKKENERRLLHRRESTLISTILRKLVRFNPGLFPYKMGGTWGQDCCQSEENGTGQYPVWMNPKIFQGEYAPRPPPPPPPTRSLHLWRLFKKYISIYPTPIAAYHTSYTWGLFFPQPSNYVYWDNYGKEVLHFVTQSDNVVLNKQGFW